MHQMGPFSVDSACEPYYQVSIVEHYAAFPANTVQTLNKASLLYREYNRHCHRQDSITDGASTTLQFKDFMASCLKVPSNGLRACAYYPV